MAALKAEGTTPDKREEFMASVMDGHMRSMIEPKKARIRSAGDELRFARLYPLDNVNI